MDTGSSAVEDYLKAIYELEGEDEAVSTSALAHRLHVAPASVTGMLKRLASGDSPLIAYERYRGVTMMPAGKRLALDILRRHRLVELFLQRALGYSLDEVDTEAERLEHVISEKLEDRIAAWLGQPAEDPHGHPIPSKQGTVAVPTCRSLSDLEVGDGGQIVSVSDENPALLRYLAESGLLPGAVIAVTARMPFGGPILVKIGERSPEPLSKEITDSVCVRIPAAV